MKFFMKTWSLMSLCLVTVLSAAETKPVFRADFDGTLNAADQNGQPIPMATNNLYGFSDGVTGKALSIRAHKAEKLLQVRREWNVDPSHRLVNKSSSFITLNPPDFIHGTIGFRIQRLGELPARHGHFLMLTLAGPNKSQLFFIFRNNAVEFNSNVPKQRGGFVIPVNAANGKDLSPFDLEFRFAGNTVAFVCCGKKIREFKFSSNRINTVTLNSYGIQTAVSLIRFKTPKMDFVRDFGKMSVGGIDESVSYSLKKTFNASEGAVMFWARSDVKNGTSLLQFNSGKKAKLWTALSGGGSSFDIAKTDNKRSIYFMRRINVKCGDWYHIALTWDKSGNARHFVNGLPYAVDFKPGQRYPDLYKADLNAITNLVISSKINASIDNLRVYDRPIANHEVLAEYRRVMPIDMILENSVLNAEKSAGPVVSVAPGGFFMRPNPLPYQPENKAKNVKFEFEVRDASGKVLNTFAKTLDIEKRTEIALPAQKYPVGAYTITATVRYNGNSFRRTFDFTSYKDLVTDAVATKADLQTDKLIFEKEFRESDLKTLLKSGKLTWNSKLGYIEAGNYKQDRYAFVVPFPKAYQGKPLILEVEWPDDKLRNMGFYMYWGTPTPGRGMTNRDRLQSGIQAGEEYPNTGKIQKVRYIFFAGVDRYLFEARTMAPGAPAAVKAVRVYSIKGNALPRLKLHLPEDMDGRSFGHFDEDQTFTTNLNADFRTPAGYPNRTTFQMAELLRYFDYTGQNLLIYPLWRYSVGFFPVEGHTGNGLFPNNIGETDFIINNFAKHGKKMIAQINYMNLTDAKFADKIEADFEKHGMILLNKDGERIHPFSSKNMANIAHPEVLRLFLRHLEEPIRTYAHNPGFAGIQYWLNFGTWEKLSIGYDDWTVNAFSKATGIKVPEKFADRYPFLTKEPVHTKWLRWRADQVTNWVAGIRRMLDKYNKDLFLMIAVSQSPTNYVEKGIDFEALKRIPGVTLVNLRGVTTARHDAHWGCLPSGIDDRIYDMNSADGKAFLKDGAIRMVLNDHCYFETFNNSLDPKNFPSYFQDNDPKQHGRFFLKTITFNVAAWDAQEIACGMQPLGTLGRDAETREFTQAYRALPAKPFVTVKSNMDPVVMRYLQTSNGTYFYAVNISNSNVKVQFKMDRGGFLGIGEKECIDLSTDLPLKKNVFELKPYQLRSFLVKNGKTVVESFTTKLPAESLRFYREREKLLKSAFDKLESNKLATELQKKTMADLNAAISQEKLGEAHRLAFSLPMTNMLKNLKSIDLLIAKKKMTDAGHYAINCGSAEMTRSADGKLFFPDHPFDGEYGYLPGYQCVVRQIPVLKNTKTTEVYRTEAYNLNGYKFKVPNGKYTVKVYMKIGYPPGFLKNDVYFKLTANGKTIYNNECLYTLMHGDFANVLERSVRDIPVTNGELKLEFFFANDKDRPSKAGPTARLINAVEVIRQK